MRVRCTLTTAGILPDYYRSVPLRFTISPAILYLVTTKSSAMVFSVSSLSAMSSAHYYRNHVTPAQTSTSSYNSFPRRPRSSASVTNTANRHHRHIRHIDGNLFFRIRHSGNRFELEGQRRACATHKRQQILKCFSHVFISLQQGISYQTLDFSRQRSKKY